MAERRFKVALSFPGEYRDEVVFPIAKGLAKIYGEEKILYDKYHRAEFALPNLDVHLQKSYLNDSDLIVVFICSEYNEKTWCKIEWRSIRELMNSGLNDDRIMFIKCGEGNVDGVFGTTDGYIDVNEVPIPVIVQDIEKRVKNIESIKRDQGKMRIGLEELLKYEQKKADEYYRENVEPHFIKYEKIIEQCGELNTREKRIRFEDYIDITAAAAKDFSERFDDFESQTRTANLYHRIGFGCDQLGEYNKALEYYDKALSIKEKVLGKEHPDTATSYNNIAGVYRRQGDYEKALEWYNKDLVICEKVLGKEHPDTATTYNNIAAVYDNLGEYEKALKWYNKALTIREKVLGKEYPDTATSYNNIAAVYYYLGEYAKALEGYNKALTIREKVLGEEHPDTASVYNNIAGVYYSQGDYEKALEWYNKDLVICEKVLGKEHPDTALTYNNIANVYDEQGEYSEALEWFGKCLKIRMRVLPGHQNTQSTLSDARFAYDHTPHTVPFEDWLENIMISN